MTNQPFLKVEDLRMAYSTRAGKVLAVNNVSFQIKERGSALAIVGESGCGKSSLALALQNLTTDNVCELSGKVLLEGEDLFSLKRSELNKRIRWKKISWVRQNPTSSLNPVYTIGAQIREVLRVCGAGRIKNVKSEEARLLDMVGLLAEDGRKYPFQLSGGMQQRACIAVALALNPSLVILDEPTSALDVSRQGAIINLLTEFKKGFSCSYIFITHDIILANQICDFFVVMYAGRIVEFGASEQILKNPLHPYTKALLNCIPTLAGERKIGFIPGEPPDLHKVRSGCPFRFREAIACKQCGEKEIELRDIGDGHLVACHLYSDDKKITRSD